ncbi:MAG: hypothetical protein H8E47_07435 [Anaerolineales bacterium]|nr:hypothetical protein [Anaerolineales bacterium]
MSETHLISPTHGGIIECSSVVPCHAPATRRLPCGAPVCNKHYHTYHMREDSADVLNCHVCNGHKPHCIHGNDAYHDNTLIVVECVYGHTYRVLQRQLSNPRYIRLALFTHDGRRYSDLSPGHIVRHGGITLHREDIARVIGPYDQRIPYSQKGISQNKEV